MKSSWKNYLVFFFTFIGGLYFAANYFIPFEVRGFKLADYEETAIEVVRVVGVMAIGLGIINIFKVHLGIIIKAKKNYFNSIALIIGFFVVAYIEGASLIKTTELENQVQPLKDLPEFYSLLKDQPPDVRLKGVLKTKDFIQTHTAQLSPKLVDYISQAVNVEVKRTDGIYKSKLIEFNTSIYGQIDAAAEDMEISNIELEDLGQSVKLLAQFSRQGVSAAVAQIETKAWSDFVQDAFFVPLGSAMFSLLGFYIASAAFRSFRVSSAQATIMMIFALIVMLGQIPHGPIFISDQLPHIRLWLINNISVPAFRAIYFCSAIAGLALAVRMWLNLERDPFSD